MFIQTAVTPNPATLKFLPGRTVMDEGTFEARERGSSRALAARQGAHGVAGRQQAFSSPTDFISVTKGEGEWQHLRPAVLWRRDRVLSLRRALARDRRR